MTKVILHGILAKEFKKTFSLDIKRPKEVFDAIACSYSNFRNRMVELSNQGIHFALLIDGKKTTSIEELFLTTNNQQIDIVPVICGHGQIFAVISVAAVKVGAHIAANAAIYTQLAFTIATMAVQMALMPKPKMDRPSADVTAAKQSFIFGSKANVAEQGIPVPVGYGRLRVGSVIIQSTIKSYPQAFDKEISLASNGPSRNNNISI